VEDYLTALFPDQRGAGLTESAPQDASGVFIDLHSYGKLILWPWSFTAQAAPNSSALRSLGKKLAYFNEYEPMQSYGLYPTDGTTEDFAYGELGLASYTVEVGNGFFESCEDFENTLLPRNQAALLYALKAARLPYQIPSGPDIVKLEITPIWIQPGAEIQIRARIDDARFFDGLIDPDEIEPIQAIQAGEAFLDTPPWITNTVPTTFSLEQKMELSINPWNGFLEQSKPKVWQRDATFSTFTDKIRLETGEPSGLALWISGKNSCSFLG